MSHNHIQEPRGGNEVIWVPRRIQSRWFKFQGSTTNKLGITTALQRSNISAQDFKKCWIAVRGNIPDKDLYSLFVKAFGVRHNVAGRVYFVEDILRRYKAMGEPVCLSGMPVYSVGSCHSSAMKTHPTATVANDTSTSHDPRTPHKGLKPLITPPLHSTPALSTLRPARSTTAHYHLTPHSIDFFVCLCIEGGNLHGCHEGRK